MSQVDERERSYLARLTPAGLGLIVGAGAIVRDAPQATQAILERLGQGSEMASFLAQGLSSLVKGLQNVPVTLFGKISGQEIELHSLEPEAALTLGKALISLSIISAGLSSIAFLIPKESDLK